MSASSSKWVTASRRSRGALGQLVCLPHAGGGASTYYPWAEPLAQAGIEVRAVQYPGHEHRISERPVDDAREMVARLADDWSQIADAGPVAIYGHSMGALLAFELAVELERRRAPNQPRRLFLGGRNPSHRARMPPSVQGLSDSGVLAMVAERYGNLPAQVLADAELRALIAPILRADLTLVERYKADRDRRSSLPFTILGGTLDTWTSLSELEEWSEYTSAGARVHMIEGAHFFHQKQRDKVLALLSAELAS